MEEKEIYKTWKKSSVEKFVEALENEDPTIEFLAFYVTAFRWKLKNQKGFKKILDFGYHLMGILEGMPEEFSVDMLRVIKKSSVKIDTFDLNAAIFEDEAPAFIDEVKRLWPDDIMIIPEGRGLRSNAPIEEWWISDEDMLKYFKRDVGDGMTLFWLITMVTDNMEYDKNNEFVSVGVFGYKPFYNYYLENFKRFFEKATPKDRDSDLRYYDINGLTMRDILEKRFPKDLAAPLLEIIDSGNTTTDTSSGITTKK